MSTHEATRDGLDRWTSTMQALCGRFETHLASNLSLFIGEITTWSHGGLSLAGMRTNAGKIVRYGDHADYDDDEHCFLVSQRSGHCQVTQAGVTIQLAPGDMMLMDSVGPCSIMPMGLIDHASLSLPRSLVHKQLQISGQAFGKVSSTKACGRILHLLMDQVCRGADGNAYAHTQGEALQSAFITLLSSGLEQAEECTGPGMLAGIDLRGYVQKVIDESLTQPNLTPASLAGRLNISVRHLYRLFEEQGDSVCRYIQRARLKRSADDLANPFLKTESITSIAYKWGFTDSAHFSRSFKKQFEQSPKDFRATSLHHPLVGAA
ncbi:MULTISPECIES: transcriptional regulator FeaR [Pseudomonas]|uniref:Transcriptional regulator FeaR n=1 Tax=Pseudomonas kribbensis TaxID=1628086 RepID=A0A4Y8VHX1_9PSED|nr:MULTISPECIES: transcriptional regulator FeaR [Pseudomonas]TFH79883.1 transcriptional regulator FeaR [Pseudomonas kribbensis]